MLLVVGEIAACKMATVTAKVMIEGANSLLWHHFGPDAIPLEAKQRTGRAGNDPDEWQKTVLATSKGQLYLEPSYVFGCLRAGAKYTTRKRGTLQPFVAATLQVLDDKILTDRWMPKGEPTVGAVKEPVYLDRRCVVNPGTGQRNIRYRVAAVAGWKASFTIAWDNTVVGEKEMEAVVRDSGKLIGIGSGRGIGMGRFAVNRFEMVNGHAKKPTTTRGVGKNTRKSLAAGQR
jgi:hypothetical protein